MSENKALPKIKMDILGGEYLLRYSMHSVAQIKKLTGVNLLDQKVTLNDPELIIALLWGALITDQKQFDGYFTNGVPDDRVKEVIAMIGRELDGEKLQAAAVKIGIAFQNCFMRGSEAKKAGEVESQATAESAAAGT